MQNLLRIGSGLAVVLAIVSVVLWRDLRAERELTEALRAQVDDFTNRAPGYIPTQRIEARPDAAVAAKNAGGDTEWQKPAQVAANPANIQNLISNPERDLMQDPEFRKARLMQTKMRLKRIYTDVAEELGLSEKETEQLFDLLAEQQMGPGLQLTLGPDGQPDRQAMEEAQRTSQAARRKQEENLQAFIGNGRQAKWQEYQLSLSARSRASEMSGMLASSGAPLTEAQLRPLTTALIAEEKYVRQQQAATSQAPMTAESLAQRQEEAVNRQEESNRRYLEVAAPHMTSKQLSLVKDVLEQQIAMSRASARMQRERMEARRAGGAAEPPVF